MLLSVFPLAHSMNNRTKSRYWLILWCLTVTGMIYGRSLFLPLFFDDLTQLPYAATHSHAQLWQTAQFAYYRPLNFLLWKFFYDLRGFHDPVLNHAVNLLFQAANGMLVGILAEKWIKPEGDPALGRFQSAFISFGAATLFLFYPFSYQGVPWVGSLNHILAIFLMLLSIVGYGCWQAKKRPILAIGSLFCAFLAPFAHENGILIGLFVLLLEGIVLSSSRGILTASSLRRLMVAGIWCLPSAIWFVIWWNIPKPGNELFINGWEGIWQTSTYFLQGIAYPFTWMGAWLKARYGWNDIAVVWGLSGVGVGTAVLYHLRTQTSYRWIFPWLWSITSVLPAIIFLKFDYVINGPRLFMLASVGLAWGWTALFYGLYANLQKEPSFTFYLSRLALGGFVAVLLWQNYSFIQERMKLHEMLGSAVFQVVDETVKTNQAGKTAVFLNFPSWLAPQTSYALGHEGVLFLPDYISPAALVSAHTNQPANLTFGRVEAIRSPMPYFYGLYGDAPDWNTLSSGPADVFVAHYQPDTITIWPVGGLGTPPSNELLAKFQVTDGETAVFLHTAHVTTQNQHTTIALTWSATAPLEDVTMFVHLLDAEGQLAAQADGDVIAGAYPLSIWQPGATIQDIRHVEMPAAPTAVLLGLYHRTTGERLTAVSADGTPWTNNAVVLPPQLP